MQNHHNRTNNMRISRVVTDVEYPLRTKNVVATGKRTTGMKGNLSTAEHHRNPSSGIDICPRSSSSRERDTDPEATLKSSRENNTVGMTTIIESAKKSEHTSTTFLLSRLSGNGSKTREARLVKMRDDLEKAQMQIRGLMGQLGQGLHWWGSFL